MRENSFFNDRIPGGKISSRPLYFYWLIDSSFSMNKEGKIEAVNKALKETLTIIQEFEKGNPFIRIFLQVITFSTGVSLMYPEPQPVTKFLIQEIKAKGRTELGACFDEFAMQLEKLPNRALPPVAILLTDGHPTDYYKIRLKKVLSTEWGKRCIRLAISVGADTIIEPLNRFIANPDIPIIKARNVDQIVEYIKLASTIAIKAVSTPKTQLGRKKSSSKQVENNIRDMLW